MSGRLAALLLLFAITAGSLAFSVSRGFAAGEAAPAGHRQPREAAPLKPGQPLHILIVGTSVTARGTWPAELQQALGPCRPEGITVERLARAGANSAWGEEALARRLEKPPAGAARPDIIILEFAGNDARLVRGMSLATADTRHRRMIATVRAEGAVPWLATMSRTFGRERLERPWHPVYQARYRTLADQLGAGLVDSSPDWDAFSRQEIEALIPDGAHFTAEAARRLILPAFVTALSPMVCNNR